MRAADLKPIATARPRRGPLGQPPWLIPLMASLSSATLSACAGTPRAPLAEPPQLVVTDGLRHGDQLCIKGRLPFGETLTLEDVTDLALAEGARARCEQSRGDALVRAADEFNAAWRALSGGDAPAE